MIYVLDASAMICFLRKENGGDRVKSVLLDNTTTCFAHALNLCEVYYDFYRITGKAGADEAFDQITNLNIVPRADLSAVFWQDAAALKAVHRMSLADAFGLALTRHLKGTFLTADRHELTIPSREGVCHIEFLR